MPDADASDHSRFPGRFVQNVLQHHDVLALARRRDHQSLSRLAEREGGPVLGGEVRRHDPVDVVTERSLFDSDGVPGFLAIVRAPFPQRSDVFIGQIHIVADVHGPNKKRKTPGGQGTVQHRRKLISPLKSKQKEKAISVRGQHSVQIPKGLLINRSADTCSQISAPAGQRTGTPAGTADPVGHVH